MSSVIHLTKAERRQVEAVAEVLRPWGLAYSLERTHHLVVKVTGPKGGVWRMLLACTPKDADTAVDVSRRKAKALVQQINARLGL